jgi:hypothetical protein
MISESVTERSAELFIYLSGVNDINGRKVNEQGMEFSGKRPGAGISPEKAIQNIMEEQ